MERTGGLALVAVLVVRGLGRGAGPGRLAGLAAAVRAAAADRRARPMRGARGALAAALVARVNHWVQGGCRSNHSVITTLLSKNLADY